LSFKKNEILAEKSGSGLMEFYFKMV